MLIIVDQKVDSKKACGKAFFQQEKLPLGVLFY